MDSKVNLSKFNPSVGFDRGASKFKEILWYIVKMCVFLTAIPYPSKFKVLLLKMFGADVGKNLKIKPRVNIHFPWKLEIGNHVWIGEEAFLLNFEKLTIGNNICISQRAFLCCGSHDYKTSSMQYRNGPITLCDGCWVGADVFVSPNTTIGMDSVIIVKSLVATSIPKNCIYGGNPATYIKNRW